jgi:hypothetical protein
VVEKVVVGHLACGNIPENLVLDGEKYILHTSKDIALMYFMGADKSHHILSRSKKVEERQELLFQMGRRYYCGSSREMDIRNGTL